MNSFKRSRFIKYDTCD